VGRSRIDGDRRPDAEVEGLAGAFYRKYSNAGRDEMSPHVTLVVPFMPADTITEGIERRLRRLVSRFEAFDYVLERFEYFESGVLYLAPDGERTFVGGHGRHTALER
jgi:2'-5' RNA ligase